MTLTVGFDATSAARQRAGIGRYTRELLGALAARPDDLSFRAVYCAGGRLEGELPPLDGRFMVRPIPFSDRVMNAVWQRARLPVPVQLWTGAIDVFHSPDFTVPPAPRAPTIVTVHDLAFLTVPECAYPTLRTYLERVVPRSVRRADHVIAVSHRTKRDLIEHLGVPPERITTIHEAAARPFFSRPDPHAARARVRALDIDGPYILSVGTLEPRKNYPRLLEAYARLRERGRRHRLVIAGGKGWLYDPIFERLRALHLESSVQFMQPDDADLAALYTCCDAFVYPSLYEGFGLPPLEALAAGVPVGCSNSSSLPEIVGDAALTFDPHDVVAMVDVVDRLLTDHDLVTRLRRAGPLRAATFSWSEAARQTVALYHAVAERG